jgi:hypothetical protein
VRVEKLVPPSDNSETHALHVKRVLDYVDVLGSRPSGSRWCWTA